MKGKKTFPCRNEKLLARCLLRRRFIINKTEINWQSNNNNRSGNGTRQSQVDTARQHDAADVGVCYRTPSPRPLRGKIKEKQKKIAEVSVGLHVSDDRHRLSIKSWPLHSLPTVPGFFVTFTAVEMMKKWQKNGYFDT